MPEQLLVYGSRESDYEQLVVEVLCCQEIRFVRDRWWFEIAE